MALKKSIWEKCHLNEKLFWGDQEDSDFGLRLVKLGVMHRPNPHAKIHTCVTYFHDAPEYMFDEHKLGKMIEHRGRKWIPIQYVHDIVLRIAGVPFLRSKMKISKFLKRFTKLSKIHVPGEKRA
jgi:hypothetical protein